jgi:hypothetical protein
MAIKSNVADAEIAVSGFVTTDHIMKYSGIGMTNIAGVRQAAKLLPLLGDTMWRVEKEVNKQAHKFPALAQYIEERDKQDAKEFEKKDVNILDIARTIV